LHKGERVQTRENKSFGGITINITDDIVAGYVDRVTDAMSQTAMAG
jgi:hypothetical protein